MGVLDQILAIVYCSITLLLVTVMSTTPRITSRINRLLRLIAILQSGEKCTIASLEEYLGVSRRTIFRDMKTLREVGCSTYYKNGTGYTLNGGLTTVMAKFTAKELLGLIMLGKFARTHSTQPMIQYGLEAIYRSISSAPPEVRAACTDIMSHISIEHNYEPLPGSVQICFLNLIRFIDEKRSCCVEMSSCEGVDKDSICFMPQALTLTDEGWKALGRSVLDETSVEIPLDRIDRIRGTEF